MTKRPYPQQLNICFVANKFPILGRSTDPGFLWPIARGMAALGHKITVLAARSNLGKSEVVRDNVHAFFLQEGTTRGALSFEEAVLQKFEDLHSKEQFHIVHSIDASAVKIAKNRKDLRVAVAYDVDATQMSQLFSIWAMSQETVGSLVATYSALIYKFLTTYFGRDRGLLRNADGVFVTNPQQRLILERYYQYPDFHTYTLPYGLEISDLSPRESLLPLKKELGLPDSSQVVVSISDFTDIKELKTLFLAFEKVAVKKANVYLILIGNGPKWKQAEYEMLRLALGRRVLMPGAVKSEEIINYISLADIFINLSSRTSGFEPSLIEAMAQKKLVIGSEVAAIANVIEDAVDGFLVRPADTHSIADLMVEVFSGQIPVEDIGEKARKKVLDIFDVQQMVQKTIESYYKIIIDAKIVSLPPK